MTKDKPNPDDSQHRSNARFTATVRFVIAMAMAMRFASVLDAQEAYGTLRRTELDAPSKGTVVVATRLSDGQVIARTVTGVQGTWRLRLTTDSIMIRALRIGYAQYVLGTVKLAAGERRDMSAVLPARTLTLPERRTAVDSRCRVRPDSASLVAQLFHEARTALTASQLVSLDGPVRSRVRVANEIWRHDERERLEVSYREYVSNALRPYGSASVDSLLEHGFVTRHVERFAGFKHAEETAVDYRVPSVDLLVDDRFLADYCLHLSMDRDDHPEWIGVGFRPARTNRRLTLIEGTLWLDRRTSELRRLEFGYAGLEGNERAIAPGGWLEFTRLETGLWLVSRYGLRMPAIGSWIEQRGPTTRSVTVRYVPVVKVTGELLELAVGAQSTFTNAATDVLKDTTLVPLPIPIDSIAATCANARGQAAVVGQVLGAGRAGLAATALRFVWRAPGESDTGWLQSEAVTDTLGRYRACGIPQDRVVTVEVRAVGHDPAAIALRIGSPRKAGYLDLVLSPEGSGGP